MANRLDITIPKEGYIINLYEKPHLAGLKKDTPQTITKYLKRPAYDAKRHNDKAQGKGEGQYEKWDWGEIIIELDSNNTDKMIQDIIRQVMVNRFGANWSQIDSRVSGDFIAAVLGESGKGRYYEAFSSMTKEEFKKASQDIGMTGKTDKYVTQNMNYSVSVIAPVLLILLAGVRIFVHIRKKVHEDVVYNDLGNV